MAEDEGFIRRWSRRKERAKRGPAAVDDAAARPRDGGDAAPSQMTRAAPAEADAASEAGVGTPARIAVEDLPDIESLSAESDFTVFLRDGVPEELRKTALRRLWGLDPVFANLDGLLEYGDDYTDAATVVENLQTAYRVGRGFISDEDEAAEAAETAGTGSKPVAGADGDAATGAPMAAPASESPAEPAVDSGHTVVSNDTDRPAGPARDKAHRG